MGNLSVNKTIFKYSLCGCWSRETWNLNPWLFYSSWSFCAPTAHLERFFKRRLHLNVKKPIEHTQTQLGTLQSPSYECSRSDGKQRKEEKSGGSTWRGKEQSRARERKKDEVKEGIEDEVIPLMKPRQRWRQTSDAFMKANNLKEISLSLWWA